MWCLLGVLVLTGCVTSPPKYQDNLCHIFDEKDDWYDDAKDAEEKWGSPVAVTMAFMHQESRFVAKAKPPRTRFLWIFPGPRPSSAYGYSQAKTTTWDWYKDKSGNWGADRDDFADAIDFIAWYNSISYQRNKINANDAYRLYLAYHEGHGGYAKATYRKKRWLLQVARKVADRAARYQSQLQKCEDRLQRSWWPF